MKEKESETVNWEQYLAEKGVGELGGHFLLS